MNHAEISPRFSKLAPRRVSRPLCSEVTHGGIAGHPFPGQRAAGPRGAGHRSRARAGPRRHRHPAAEPGTAGPTRDRAGTRARTRAHRRRPRRASPAAPRPPGRQRSPPHPAPPHGRHVHGATREVRRRRSPLAAQPVPPRSAASRPRGGHTPVTWPGPRGERSAAPRDPRPRGADSAGKRG